jgi:hypothetical protein
MPSACRKEEQDCKQGDLKQPAKKPLYYQHLISPLLCSQRIRLTTIIFPKFKDESLLKNTISLIRFMHFMQFAFYPH